MEMLLNADSLVEQLRGLLIKGCCMQGVLFERGACKVGKLINRVMYF